MILPGTGKMKAYIGGTEREVHIEKKRRMKNMYLRVNRDGSLRITCPYGITDAQIQHFIREKENWILKVTAHQKRREVLDREGTDSPVIWWLGEKKYVRYEQAAKDHILMDGDIMTFYLKDFSRERISSVFRKYAAAEIRDMIAESREVWDREICMRNNLPLPVFQIRYMTSRWGVCKPSDHKITMSVRLIHYPREAFESVLLHEYVHFLVPDHSARFYQIVRHYMPMYDRYNGLLK